MDQVLSFPKLVCAVSWCRRFITRCCVKSTAPADLPLQLDHQEIEDARHTLLREAQRESFPDTLHVLQDKKPLPRSNNLRTLHPFLGEDDLIRVGGHLGRSNLTYQAKHSVILHHSSPVVKLMVHHLHVSNSHVGPSILLSLLSESYRVLRARRLTRAISRTYVICQRSYARCATANT